MTASAGSGARASALGLAAAALSDGAALSGAVLAGAVVGAGAWLAGDGVALVLVQAPTAKTRGEPEGQELA